MRKRGYRAVAGCGNAGQNNSKNKKLCREYDYDESVVFGLFVLTPQV
jgi:hypothetical protein